MAAIGRGIKDRGAAADPPRALPSEAPAGKPGAAVGRGPMLAVVSDMRDAQIVLPGRVAVIDHVEFGTAIVRRAGLIALGRIARAAVVMMVTRDCASGFFQRLERRVDIVTAQRYGVV